MGKQGRSINIKHFACQTDEPAFSHGWGARVQRSSKFRDSSSEGPSEAEAAAGLQPSLNPRRSRRGARFPRAPRSSSLWALEAREHARAAWEDARESSAFSGLLARIAYECLDETMRLKALDREDRVSHEHAKVSVRRLGDKRALAANPLEKLRALALEPQSRGPAGILCKLRQSGIPLDFDVERLRRALADEHACVAQQIVPSARNLAQGGKDSRLQTPGSRNCFT
jgi:hypothetical protein